MKILASLAVAATALMACNKEVEIQASVLEQEDVTLSFVSEKPALIDDAETRTVYNTESGVIDWVEGDKIKVAIKVNNTWMGDNGIPDEGKYAKLYTSTGLTSGGSTGVFKVPTTFTSTPAGNHYFYGLYPASLVSDNDAKSIPQVKIIIPESQKPLANSFDSKADVMFAVSEEYSEIPTDRSINLDWTRIVAHADITLKKLPVLAEGETVQTIEFVAQEGADLAGSHLIDITDGTIALYEGATPVNAITILAENLSVNTENNTLEFWMSTLPFTANSIKIILSTNKKVYTKEYTNINKEFLANRRNTLGIGMANADVKIKNQLIPNGEYVIASDAKGFMMSAGASSESYRGYKELNAETPSDDAIWTITYDEANDAYRIYNSDAGLYLWGATGDNNYLELKEASYYDGSFYTDLFQITFSDEDNELYHITPLGNTVRSIGYNITQPRFALYKGSHDQTIDLNLHAVSFDTTPRIEIVTNPVSLAKSEISTAREITTIKRKYFDGAIAASTNADWITVNDIAAGETSVTATVQKNTGAQRTAIITLSAEGIDSKTFEVVQAVGADEVVDVINRALTEVTGTGYTSWSGKTSNSAAIYAGKSAGGNDAIQLSNSTSTAAGIITTHSGGIVKKISVDWNSNTADGRKIFIYGKNTAYTSAQDIHSTSTATSGTKLGELVKGSSDFLIDGEYEYFGIKAVGGSLYLDEIRITWGDAKEFAPISWSANEGYAEMTENGIDTSHLPTFSNTNNLEVTFASSDTNVATIDASGAITIVGAGTATISATYTGTSSSPYKTTIVEFTLEVEDNRPTVATPTFSPNGGTFTSAQNVTISCATSGATIHYTTDNSTPTASSATYSGAISVTATTTIKAIAVKSGMQDSAVASATYTISGGTDALVYTLEPATGSNNNYANNCDVTISGIKWNITGNSQTVPWRLGGKSITKVDRSIYSKTALNYNISKIDITHGAASSITVNSMTVVVATDASFSNVVSTLTPTFAANSTVTVNRPAGVSWSNCYYKITYNVTVSGSSNKFIEFSKAEFTGK